VPAKTSISTILKSLALYIFLSIAGSGSLLSQKVYTTTYASQADAILYETNRKSEADILIYKVDYSSQVDAANGLWLDVAYKSQADWSVYWAQYKSQADCVVYFVKYRSHARANNCFLNGHRKQ
jgi:Family of unknown function (DUF6150)